MIVYALLEWVPYEGSYLYGVYSTEGAAQAAIASALDAELSKKHCRVHPIEVDGPPKWVDDD